MTLNINGNIYVSHGTINVWYDHLENIWYLRSIIKRKWICVWNNCTYGDYNRPKEDKILSEVVGGEIYCGIIDGYITMKMLILF